MSRLEITQSGWPNMITWKTRCFCTTSLNFLPHSLILIWAHRNPGRDGWLRKLNSLYHCGSFTASHPLAHASLSVHTPPFMHTDTDLKTDVLMLTISPWSSLQLSHEQQEKSDPDDHISHAASPSLPPAPPWTPWYALTCCKIKLF